MLINIYDLKDWFSTNSEADWDFDEITFDEETKNCLSSLKQFDGKISFFGHSIKVMNNDGNHCYMSSQNFLYAIKIKPALILLNKYRMLYEALKENKIEGKRITQKQIVEIIQNKSKEVEPLNTLDLISLQSFFEFLNPKDDDDSGKKFIKKDGSFRNDGFGSALLKLIPVPDTNASELSKLLLGISTEENMAAINLLCQKYSHAIPWLFRNEDADELMFRVMSALGWEGKLDDLQDTEPVSWCGIADALLTRPTPGPNNDRYVASPVHYLESCRKYVFVRKGLLNETSLDAISRMVGTYWPGMCIRLRDNMYYVESEKRHRVAVPAITGGTNRIFYGAPGTGKSHRVHQACPGETDKFVTVFHPDTQHADFVGSLKPVTQNDQVMYRFRPGPFTDALVHALLHPDRQVTLVIEEINRASAAAVFGELFQLLDRKPCGESTYSIRAADPDMLGHINGVLEADGLAPLDVLRIPSNLSLLATMNSSDQAVMPLDTAFKRRWGFEYLPIDFRTAGIAQTVITLTTASGPVMVTWPALAEIINAALVECDVPEDRLLGPFFLSTRELENEEKAGAALGGKLFIYLWDDVLRHHGHDRIFAAGYKTYGALSAAYKDGKPVFSPAIEEALVKACVKAGTAEDGPLPDSGTAQDAGS